MSEKARIHSTPRGQNSDAQADQKLSGLKKAWHKATRVGRIGYYTLSAAFLAATALYLTPMDWMPEMSPKMELRVAGFKIKTSELLVSLYNGDQSPDAAPQESTQPADNTAALRVPAPNAGGAP